MDIEVTAKLNEDVFDIPTMRDMSLEEYRGYVRQGLFFVDHHEVLRSTVGEWPIAVTKDQVLALIAYLQEEVLPRHE